MFLELNFPSHNVKKCKFKFFPEVIFKASENVMKVSKLHVIFCDSADMIYFFSGRNNSGV